MIDLLKAYYFHENDSHRMKGIVFTEFLNLVEEKYGYETVDSIIQECHLPSGGAYTAVGTYPHSEMVQLVKKLSDKTHIAVPDLLKIYGKYLFTVFLKAYGHFLKDIHSAFQLLSSIDKYIHVEVQKLYPDAELPVFETTMLNENTLEMIYRSERSMADFAEGLIEATLNHYQEKATIERTDIKKDGTVVRFMMQKQIS